MPLRVHGLQVIVRDAYTPEDKHANVEDALRAVRACPESDLIVLPELCTVGYGERVFQALPSTADSRDSETIARFCAAARDVGAYLAVGFPERAGSQIYNSVAIISDQGALVDVYRKTHLPQFTDTREREHFAQGDRAIAFSVKGVKVGVIVCYDIRFPEISRRLAFDENVDLLIHPTGFFRDETFVSWHPFVVTRAIENQVYVLSVNRAGANSGCSLFCPPLLDWPRAVIELGTNEGIVSGQVDPAVLESVRATYQYRQGRNPSILFREG